MIRHFKDFQADQNYWDLHSEKSIMVFEVPGNHETLLQEPHVQTLAQLINDQLDNAESVSNDV